MIEFQSFPTDEKVGLDEAIANLLTAMSVQIEGLGADLCADPVIVQRHLTSLQTIDKLAQYLEQIAFILNADNPFTAIDQVRLADLKEHLRAVT